MNLPTLVFIALAVLASGSDATERSNAAKQAFVKAVPCPSTGRHTVSCKGYVIDHVKALDCGGDDAPWNMQWQTIAAAKAKDKWERNGPTCKHRTHGTMP